MVNFFSPSLLLCQNLPIYTRTSVESEKCCIAYLQSLGQNGVVLRLQHAFELSQYLQLHLANLPRIRLLVSPKQLN